MTQRFFCTDSLDQPQVRLREHEAHHLIHVMRLSAGDEVLLFDGSGAESRAKIERLGRSEVVLAVISRQTVDRELSFSLTLGVALPKGDRQKWLIEKAVELGVTRLVPLVTERSVAQPVAKALDRLRRGVIEACKQCGRNRLMEISEPQDCGSFVQQADTDNIALVAHPLRDEDMQEPASATSIVDLAPRLQKAGEVIVLVGPEGGLTDLEVEDATRAGWLPVDLGPRILRIETAALAIAAQLAAVAD